jgi:exosortase
MSSKKNDVVSCIALLGLATLWLVPMSTAWRNSADLGHSWAVPVLMAYLWWERWAERPQITRIASVSARWWLLAASIAALAIPIRLLLTPFPLWPALLAVHTLLLCVTVLGFAWLTSGPAGVRWTAGPLVLALSALPIPSYIENSAILPLRQRMAELAAEISNIVGFPALAFGTSVKLGNGWVGIDEACGGIRSLQACVMIGLFFGEWYRFRVGRRIALVCGGIVAALLGNFARVVFLALMAGAQGSQVVDALHDRAGWVSMAASLILTGWMGLHLGNYRFPSWNVTAAAPARNHVPKQVQVWLVVLVLFLGFSEGITRAWYARGDSKRTLVPRWSAYLPESAPTFIPQPLENLARDILRPDYFRAGQWQAKPDVTASAYYIEWHKGQVARSVPFLHNPTVCLPVAGCELVETLRPILVEWQGGVILFNAYKFRRMGSDILVAFTIWDSSRNQLLVKHDTQTWAVWWSRQWQEVIEAQQHQPAQLLTVSLPWSNSSFDDASTLLRTIILADPGNQTAANENSF